MPRLQVCILAALLAVASLASAATPRVQALGGDGAYLEDAGNVLRWSGSLADHAGRATVGTGTFDGNGYPREDETLSGPWAGVQYALGGEKRPFAGALYLMSRSSDQGDGSFGAGLQAGAFHALVAMNGEIAAVTASWRRAGAADDDRGEAREEIGLGVRFDVGPGAYMDVAGEITQVMPRDAVRDTLPEDENTGVCYSLRTRMFVGLSESLVLVAVASADTEDRHWGLGGTASPWPTRHLRLGAALTWLPDPDRLVLVSVDYRNVGIPHGATTAALLFRAALEARLNAFLSVRAAGGWEERNAPDESVAPLSCGLAVHAGNWDLDLTASTTPPLDPTGRRPGYGKPALAWLSTALSLAF